MITFFCLSRVFFVMFCKFLLALLSALPILATAATGDLSSSYQYKGEHGIDFSSISSGPLEIAEFSDARDRADPHVIPQGAADGGKDENGFRSAQPLAELVRSALVQAFEAGNAELAGEDGALILVGELTEFSSDGNAGEIQVTVKAKVRLTKSDTGSELFSSTIFGRGSGSGDNGLASAVADSLDALVNSLLWDEYFLMHLLD